MTSEQVSEIIELKRIPLTTKMWFSHYLRAILPAALACYFIFKYFIVDIYKDDCYTLVLGILILTPSLYIFLYLGKKQLKLKKIPIKFLDNNTAFLLSKQTFNYYNWPVIEEINDTYIKALRRFHLGKIPLEQGAQAISVFIEHGEVYVISLFHPTTESAFFTKHKKNAFLFEKKLCELYNTNSSNK